MLTIQTSAITCAISAFSSRIHGYWRHKPVTIRVLYLRSTPKSYAKTSETTLGSLTRRHSVPCLHVRASFPVCPALHPVGSVCPLLKRQTIMHSAIRLRPRRGQNPLYSLCTNAITHYLSRQIPEPRFPTETTQSSDFAFSLIPSVSGDASVDQPLVHDRLEPRRFQNMY